MITSYLYERLPYIKEAWYFRISKKHRALIKDYFVFFPEGYASDEVDQIIDVSDVWDDRIQTLYCHQSQKGESGR